MTDIFEVWGNVMYFAKRWLNCLILLFSLSVASCDVNEIAIQPNSVSEDSELHMGEQPEDSTSVRLPNSIVIQESADDNAALEFSSLSADTEPHIRGPRDSILDTLLNLDVIQDHVTESIEFDAVEEADAGNFEESNDSRLDISIQATGVEAHSPMAVFDSPGIAWSHLGDQLAYYWLGSSNDDRPNGIYLADMNDDFERRFACSLRDVSQELYVDNSLPLFWLPSDDYVAATVREGNMFGSPRIGLCDIETGIWSLALTSDSSSILLDWQNNSILFTYGSGRYLTTDNFNSKQRLPTSIYDGPVKLVGNSSTIAYLNNETIIIVDLDSPSNEIRIPTSIGRFRLTSNLFTVSPNGQFITWVVWNGDPTSYRDSDKVQMMIYDVGEGVTFSVGLHLEGEELDSGWHPPSWSPDSTRFALGIFDNTGVLNKLYISEELTAILD